MKKIGLVLSGGSAYGFAHIGVIKELEKNNIPIDIVSGTSMGAIIGGLYSAGLSASDMEKALIGFSKIKIIDLNLFGLTDGGFLYGKKVVNIIKKLVANKNFEDCEKKFCCIAADLKNGKKYVFEKGPLVQGIRASMSVPGIFKPIKMDKMILVDGGVVDNLPVDDARRLGADAVIAVDVCSHYKKRNNLVSAIDVLISATNLMGATYLKLQEDKGDIYMKIDQPNVLFDRFSYEDAINSIKNGEKMAQRMMPEILKLVEDCQTDKVEQNL